VASAFQNTAFQNNAFQSGPPPVHTCPDPTQSYVGSYVATAVNDGCVDGLICAPSNRTEDTVREPERPRWTLNC
jgi:hypothetical protein